MARAIQIIGTPALRMHYLGSSFSLGVVAPKIRPKFQQWRLYDKTPRTFAAFVVV
ncbi:hypothetical protein L208DRAFT_1399315, partial [Tricholoma matsutake]